MLSRIEKCEFGYKSRELSLLIVVTCMQVPFILVERGKWPLTDFVVVNMDGSRHPLPLTTVYHQLQPVNPSPYTFLQALFGHEYPVSLLLLTSLGFSFLRKTFWISSYLLCKMILTVSFVVLFFEGRFT